MALTWMAAVVNHVVLRPSFLHEFHGPRKPRNPNLLDKFICLISHDGSMVLVYMVCHGSHQYTPVMLAYIPAPAGSVMGMFESTCDHKAVECLILKNPWATVEPGEQQKWLPCHVKHAKNNPQIISLSINIPL